MRTAARTELTSTVSGVSDDQLLEQTGNLARLDHQVQVFVVDHLLKIETRKLYLSRGYSGLFDYVAWGLGYSAAAAWRRINAMKLCAAIEGVRERLWDGSLTLDAAAQLQAAFERRDCEQARAACGSGAGTGLAMEPNGKSTRQVVQMLAGVDPELGVPADRVSPLSGERWEMKVVIDAACQGGLEQLKGIFSHVDPHMTLGQLVGRLLREGIDRHHPGRPRRGRRPPAQCRTVPATAPAKQDDLVVPAPLRDAQRGVTGASAPNSQRDPDRQAPSAPKRSARPASPLR